MSDNEMDNEETLAETENYEAWISYEDDGEVTYHLDMGRATLHFFQEEWTEFLALMRDVIAEEEE